MYVSKAAHECTQHSTAEICSRLVHSSCFHITQFVDSCEQFAAALKAVLHAMLRKLQLVASSNRCEDDDAVALHSTAATNKGTAAATQLSDKELLA
jgi:hypothetical protein